MSSFSDPSFCRIRSAVRPLFYFDALNAPIVSPTLGYKKNRSIGCFIDSNVVGDTVH